MIVAYCFHPGDQDLALKNARWMTELGGCHGHEMVCAYDPRCNPQLVEEIRLELLKSFDKLHRCPAPAEIEGWPQGANYFFRIITAWLQDKPQWPYFLWMEPDAIFTQPRVLDELDAEYKRGNKPFMGERVDIRDKKPEVPVHMSGIGIYQNPIYALAGEAYRAHDVAWDIAAKDQIIPHAHFTKTIQHYWKHGTFTDLSEIRPETLIFHSSKDGSLIDLLRKKAALETDAPSVATEPTSGLPPSREEIGTRPAQPLIRKLPGDIWVLADDEVISEQVAVTGHLDFDPLIPFVLPHIRPGDSVVDVGAFIGDHTVAYSVAVGKAGKVFAYEPHPVAFECLKHNTLPCGNVFGFQHALGKERGAVSLGTDYSPASAYIGNGSKEIALVVMRPLDEDMPLFGQLDLIKIDAEGYELNVLKGAEQVIEKFHPKMVIEINETALGRQNATPDDIMNWIVPRGYQVSVLHRHGPNVPFYDILCVPQKPPEIQRDDIAHTPASDPLPVAVRPANYGEMIVAIQVIKDFAAQNTNNRIKAMVNLRNAGLTPAKSHKKKKHESDNTTTKTAEKRKRKQPAEEHAA